MRDIFNSHPVSVLKQEISKSNIKGYSKMKKKEVVDLMMKNKEKFSYIKMAVKKEAKPRKPRGTKEEKETKTEVIGTSKEKTEAFNRVSKAMRLYKENRSKYVNKQGKLLKKYKNFKDQINDIAKGKRVGVKEGNIILFQVDFQKLNKKLDEFAKFLKVKI